MEIQTINSTEGEIFNGLFLLTPKTFSDERGEFYESWNQAEFNKATNQEIKFVQDNHSFSKVGVLRGLHYQLSPVPQGKLVRCTLGSIYDVAVDLRKSSPTFSQWIGIELNSKNKKQFWIPEGFAHGFLTLSEIAEVQYKTTNYWDRNHEKTIIWNDKSLKINWPLEKTSFDSPTLSEKDLNAQSFKEVQLSNSLFK